MVYRSCLTDRRLELGCQGDAAHLLVSGAMGSFPSFRKSETRNVNSPGPDFPFPAIHLNFGGCSVFCCKHSKRAIIFVCEPWICGVGYRPGVRSMPCLKSFAFMRWADLRS